MNRALLILLVIASFCGCQSYVAPPVPDLPEMDLTGNYERIFQEPIPSNVTVVNFAVVTYDRDVNGDFIEGKIGVTKAIEHEFELIVPREWIKKQAKRFRIRRGDGGYIKWDTERHRARARSWYAPKAIDQYDLYSDGTMETSAMTSSADAWVHMLVQKAAEADGRWRVFFGTEHVPR